MAVGGVEVSVTVGGVEVLVTGVPGVEVGGAAKIDAP